MSVEKKNAYIGVDLGGTNMRAGRIAGDRLVAQGNAPTPQDAADCGETLEALIEVIRSVWDEGVVAIGIGVPSVVDREKGIVYNVVNIPHWEEVHLKEILEARFSVPVYVDNDANCFALGERIFGDGKTVDNFVGLTLGTGLGGGIIQKGKLLADANCGSGEFGMIPYQGMGRGWEGDVHPCDAEGRAGAGGLSAVGRTCGRRYQDRGIDGRSGDDRLRRLGDLRP